MGHEDQSHSVSVAQENAVKVISRDMHEVKGDRGAHISDHMDVLEGKDSHNNCVNLPCPELGKDVIATGSGDLNFKESKPLSETRTPKDYVEHNNTVLPNGHGILTVQTTESASSAEFDAAVSVKDNSSGRTTGFYFSEEEKKHHRLQTEDFKLNEPRCGELVSYARLHNTYYKLTYWNYKCSSLLVFSFISLDIHKLDSLVDIF